LFLGNNLFEGIRKIQNLNVKIKNEFCN